MTRRDLDALRTVVGAMVGRPRQSFPSWARDNYRAAGWRIIEPGSPAGALLHFEGRDWHGDSFLAHRANDMHLALLRARRPREGAFTRLVNVLQFDGYRVTVNTPLGEFREALTRRGWRCEERGDLGEFWRHPNPAEPDRLSQI